MFSKINGDAAPYLFTKRLNRNWAAKDALVYDHFWLSYNFQLAAQSDIL